MIKTKLNERHPSSLGPSALNPPMWAAATEDDYLATLGLVPAYVSKVMRNSNERRSVSMFTKAICS